MAAIKDYDVLVIGSGSGYLVVDAALDRGWRVAWVDKGPVGGTCINLACIPSKVLIFCADRIVEIQEAHKLGVHAVIDRVDFGAIMERMKRVVDDSLRGIRETIRASPNLDFYQLEGHFVGERTLQVGGERIRAKKVYVAAGARPLTPPIEGLQGVDYLTNESVLELDERPESLLIVGGGYVGVEYGHFFSAMGTEVTVVQRNERLVPDEEPEISALLKQKMAERMNVRTETEIVRVEQGAGGVSAVGRDVRSGQERRFRTERLMIAVGRRSNADLLQVENAGLALDERGYVQVDEYLEANVEDVWAFGDITGGHMFTHVANEQATIAWHNSTHKQRVAMDYHAIPHAVFGHPQIASVGLTEEQARRERDILVGKVPYTKAPKGEAMMAQDGFAKAIVGRASGTILGFHVIGPYAPILIQEVINAMAAGGGIPSINAGLHIHPALPELVKRTLSSLARAD